MPFPPQPSNDFFDAALQFAGDQQPTPADGFQAANVPTNSGLGTRQSRFPSERRAVSTRKLMHWLVPEGPIVEMYINPQSVKYNYSKDITPTRTKGGFVIQYWGEALTVLNIQGTTGTSGIEGINVLYDIYRNEQLAFDPFALFLAAKQQQNTFGADVFGVGSALSSGENFVDSLIGASQEANPQARMQSPTLASLAMQVELYWSGEVYRGYFNSFSVTESVTQLGMFDYDIQFTVTQKRGIRRNFLAWHRSATSGPSNSDPVNGTPHSFGALAFGTAPTPQRIGPDGTLTQTLNSAGQGLSDLFSFEDL